MDTPHTHKGSCWGRVKGSDSVHTRTLEATSSYFNVAPRCCATPHALCVLCVPVWQACLRVVLPFSRAAITKVDSRCASGNCLGTQILAFLLWRKRVHLAIAWARRLLEAGRVKA